MLWLLFLTFEIWRRVSSQVTCPVDIVFLDSPAKLNTIPDGCTTIFGGIWINGSSLTQSQLFQKFSTVTSINGGVLVVTNTPFTNLSFFQNLQTIIYPDNTRYLYTFYAFLNPSLTTLGLPKLTSVSSGTNFSFIVEENPKLCISRTELNNVLQMEGAYFLAMPLCEVDKTFCYEPTVGYYTSTDSIPAGCQYMNAGLQLNQINDMSKLTSVKEIYGPIVLNNMNANINITLNVQLIYNQLSTISTAIMINNDQILSFRTPNLTKIMSYYAESANIIIQGNPKLQLTEDMCSLWNRLTSVTTSRNGVDCAYNSYGNSSSALVGNTGLIICLFFYSI